MSTPAALSRRREYAGPAVFSYGFRPFFLAAAIWACLSILLWLPVHVGDIVLPTTMPPLDWHMHEMLYGYIAAAVAGFLLTAIPNWTGRLPVCGLPLAALVLLWLAGRLAIIMASQIGAMAAAVIDLSFLTVLAVVALREIVAGRNWRNLRVLAVLGIFVAANIVWHVELIRSGTGDYGPRLAIAAVIGLLMLIGGRIVPSFTRNWLVRMNPGRLPQPFSRYDALTIAVSALALAAWVILADGTPAGAALMTAGVLQLGRLARWAGDRTLADRLVLVLHVAYAFIPIGFLLIGAAALGAIPDSAGLHAWMTGGAGMMTLAVMTRASLGHTGQPLVASPTTQAIYALALLAALARIAAAFTGSLALIHLAGAAWIAAFGGFAFSYGRLLIMRPPAWSARR